MGQLVLPGITVVVDDDRQAAETTIAAAGAYSLSITTVVIARSAVLTSSYLAALHPIEILVGHLAFAPGWEPPPSQRMLDGPQPGAAHASVCLLDHVAELHHALLELSDGASVRVDVDDVALDVAAGAWRPTA